jgi:GTP pyrophosphokinase
MLHSQIVNTASRTRDDWIERFWISGIDADYHRVVDAVDRIINLGAVHRRDMLPNSLDVAEILLSLQANQEILLAALLSDYRLINSIDLDEIKPCYGEHIAKIVNGVHQLHTFVNCRLHDQPSAPEQAETLRRMLLTMASDVWAVLIKLAWRLQHLRILSHYETEYRTWIAQDSLDIFAPLASRLGVSQLKWEMEDLAFRYINPIAYKQVAKSLQSRRLAREIFIDNFVLTVQSLLKESNIEANVCGRPKHIYSIWKKMQRKGLEVDQLYDLRAVRIIVDDIESCYHIMWLVHKQWRHIPHELDDYIAQRKPNGYQSIHTVVFAEQGKTVEVQIRTKEMHMVAELGVAAHWRYKEGGAQDQAMEEAIMSLRHLLDNQNSDAQLVVDFHTEVFSDRVFVLTPKGKIFELPKCSTPLDFAYAVHTSIGHRCRGALVNGVMVSLDYVLKNGDKVEILTSKEEHPRRDWMNPSLSYACSAKTRSKIRYWFHQQNHEKNALEGKLLFEKECRRLGMAHVSVDDLVLRFKKQDSHDFFIALGRDDITTVQLIDALVARPKQQRDEIELRQIPANDKSRSHGITVNGVENLMTQLSVCCKPVLGDSITGFITIGRGVSIHRQDCPNILNMSEDQQKRLVDVSWTTEQKLYAADIIVIGYNLPGLLRDVADVFAQKRINIVQVVSKLGKEVNTSVIRATIQIESTQQLSAVLDKITQLSNVIDAKRQV